MDTPATDRKVTMSFTNGRGEQVERDVNQIIDIRDFVGTPGYALLVAAANTNLSAADIDRFLSLGGVERSPSWIRRRRWLFLQPDTDITKGRRANEDGTYERAVKIMRENPTMSIRALTWLLKERGIKRGREWVRQHKCD